MRTDQRGSALLAVIWLTAALSAIAFTVANTVRAETERTSTEVDSVKAYYLATGAINRAIVHIEWGPGYRNPDGSSKFGGQGPLTVMQFEFPSGSAVVNVIPETAKLNVNQAPPEQLMNLVVALGTLPEQAQAITQGILDWRKPSPGGSFTQFDQYYLTLTPSFRARHASFQEIEELLLVRGSNAGLVLRKLHPRSTRAAGAPCGAAGLPVGLRIGGVDRCKHGRARGDARHRSQPRLGGGDRGASQDYAHSVARSDFRLLGWLTGILAAAANSKLPRYPAGHGSRAPLRREILGSTPIGGGAGEVSRTRMESTVPHHALV